MRRWRWLLALLLLATGGWLGLRLVLQPERLGAFVVQQLQSASGLDIQLARPATLGLWPQLHLSLGQPRVSGSAAATPLLRAESMAVYLPLRVLWSPLEITAVEIDRASVDVAALQQWLNQRRDDGPPAPIRLPSLGEFALLDSRIDGGDWQLEHLQLRLVGLASADQLQASLQTDWQQAGASIPLFASLSAEVLDYSERLQLRETRLAIGATSATPSLQLRGTIDWQMPWWLELDLQGELSGWPTQWPALSPELIAAIHQLPMRLRHAGVVSGAGSWHLHAGADERQLDLQFSPAAVLDWWNLGDWSQPPPLQLNAQLERWQFDGFQFEGVRVLTSSPAPAAESDDTTLPEQPDAND